ncbi:MAG: 3'(2'),5'-bisphosphate nucleotidase CysQ [Gemmatimonadetes bacterium]|nr:3'(2'),5'-bisphosphate nucleotidase CysQ [Gemmatimonadota bacterium]
MTTRDDDLARIEEALGLAAEALRPFTSGDIDHVVKDRGDPLTEADLAVNRVLLGALPGPGEGWLSEETRDDPGRLDRRRVWVVDPIDGTREFVDGIPEWCVSIGLVEDGEPVAGGIHNPATGETMVGAVGHGVRLNGSAVEPTDRAGLEGAVVLASRTEVNRGEWERFAEAPFRVIPCGSVAYKLACVAAGLADATWTLVPKHEWDVAGGAALLRGAGGVVVHADGTVPRFNRRDPLLPDFLAGHPELLEAFRREWVVPERRDGLP